MSQKTDSMIKMALVFFVSLLSFSIGTYVGKKYSDNQHKLALLEPKKEVPTPKAEEFASDASETDKTHGLANSEIVSTEQKPAALTDSEVAKIAEEFATEDSIAEEKLVATIDPQEKVLSTITEMPQVKPMAKPTVKTVQIPTHNSAPLQPAAQPAIQASTQTTLQKLKQIENSAEVRIPASINPKTQVVPMHYTVQIGAYPTQTEAEKITKDLQSKGYKTAFVPATVNGQTWFRVNVGLFGTVKEAQDYKKEFLEKTKITSAIVQRVLQ